MTPQTFIEKAIKGGYDNRHHLADLPKSKNILQKVAFLSSTQNLFFYKMLLDPRAWQAVGKVEGWNIECPACSLCREKRECPHNEPIKNMHRMIDALVEASQKPEFNVGKTIEEYLKTL